MQNRSLISHACLFLIFLLLTPASPICRQGTVDECRKARYVPGSSFAGNSILIHELIPHYLFEEIRENTACTLCENPLLEGKPFQRLPTVINNWEANISCQEKVQHSIQHSAISVAEALTELKVKNDWRYNLDVISSSDKVQWAVAGSRSEMTKGCVQKSKEDRYIFLLLHITCSYYKFNVSKDRLLHAEFNVTINNLPPRYDASSKYEYDSVINYFGTHWIKEFDVGAQMREVVYISPCNAWLEGLSISEISRCLDIDLGIAFGLDGFTDSTQFHDCEEMRKKYYLERRLEVVGNLGFSTHVPKVWLEQSKLRPGLISSSVEPLHTLLDKSNPKRDELKKALSEYVKQRALCRNCTKLCPPGSQTSASDICTCECPNNNFTNGKCCAHKRGLSKLMVTIEYAEHLWGDLTTRSDAYVSVAFKNRKMCTHTVWNNDNPTWNATFDFGVIELNEDFNTLDVEVWDEDSGWDDDRLGDCKVALEPGPYVHRTCYMNHLKGQIHLKYHLVCGHNLFGASCWYYLSGGADSVYNSPDYYYYLF